MKLKQKLAKAVVQSDTEREVSGEGKGFHAPEERNGGENMER